MEALALALGLGAQERAILATAWERGTADHGQCRLRSAVVPLGSSQVITIRLLGPLTVERAGSEIDVGPVRRRAVLALLALGGEAGVQLSDLIDLLWPTDAPVSAEGVIQGHVSKLRRLLSAPPGNPVQRQPIAWTGTSYRMGFGPHCRLDSADFAELAREGDQAAHDREPENACRLYERALGLWRGSVVADLDCLQMNGRVTALNRQRSEVAVRFADVAGRVGDHGRAIPHLREACLAEPLSEVLHARLIQALLGTGRHAEVVAVFGQLRDRLGAELGIGPSDLVWHAYRQVVGRDRQDRRRGAFRARN